MVKDLEIKFAHIYPKMLNLYGDTGNVLTLKKRCEWRNIKFIHEEINIGDKFTEHDLYFIGGGQDRQQVDVAQELHKYKDFLIQERDKNAVFLSICGGYQLLGHYYKAQDGSELKGISLLDAYTLAGSKRFIGNVTSEIDFLTPNTLVGFENHSGLTYLQCDTKPIARILTGNGNNGKDKTEGSRYKNVFWTYLHGSFLPKNPHFADYLIELAIEKKYGEKIKLEPLNDEIENETHNNLVNKPY